LIVASLVQYPDRQPAISPPPPPESNPVQSNPIQSCPFPHPHPRPGQVPRITHASAEGTKVPSIHTPAYLAALFIIHHLFFLPLSLPPSLFPLPSVSPPSLLPRSLALPTSRYAMAPRFKSLFGWSSSIPDKLPRGRSFEPPISSSDYATPLQPREPPVERPKTAPQKTPASNPGIDGSQRTRSGFSTKSPPTFAATASRKNSVASTRGRRSSSIWTVRTPAEAPPPLPTAVPSLDHLPPLPLSPAVVGGFSTSSFSPPVSPPLSLDSSLASPKPYIDILDAHSSIKAARVRSKPLIVRDYGEDVADRNIASFGAKTDQKPISSLTQRKHLDILVLGNDGIKKSGDPQYDAPPSPRTTSIRSFTAPRPGIAYPPRSDSLRSDHTLSSSVSGDERVVPSSSGQDRRGHAKSPLASPITSRFEDAQIQPPRPPMASPVRPAPAPPSTERARQRSTSVATVRSTSHPQPVPPLPASDVPSRQTSTSSSQPDMATRSGSPKAPSGLDAGRGVILPSAAAGDDVPPTKNGTTITDGATSSSSISLSTATGTATPRTASPHSVSTHAPSPSTASSKAASRKRASSRQGSVSYSAFPSCNPRESRASDMSTTSRARSNSTRRDYRGSDMSTTSRARSNSTRRDYRGSDMSTTSRARSSSRRRDYVGSTGTAGPTPVIVVGDSADTQVTTKTLPGR
jgi:hypothetical protein